MGRQPLLGVLFRPEEVVGPSAAATNHVRLGRIDLYYLAPVDHDPDALHAMRAGVFNDDPLVWVIAADQQQEVDRSRHIEPLPVLQGYDVKIEPQTPGTTLEVF